MKWDLLFYLILFYVLTRYYFLFFILIIQYYNVRIRLFEKKHIYALYIIDTWLTINNHFDNAFHFLHNLKHRDLTDFLRYTLQVEFSLSISQFLVIARMLNKNRKKKSYLLFSVSMKIVISWIRDIVIEIPH
jgi:hypothetical protein